MIRNTLAAIANAIWRPTPEPFPMQLAMTHPVLLPKAAVAAPVAPPVAPPPKRFYHVRDGADPVHIVGAAANDLMAYPHTRNALTPALEAYGSLHAHTVVIETRDWIGEFTIDANDNADRLVLELVEAGEVQPQQMEAREGLPAWA